MAVTFNSEGTQQPDDGSGVNQVFGDTQSQTSWADKVGGTGKLSDLAAIGLDNPTALQLAGFRVNPDGTTATRMEMKDAGIAAKQNASGIDGIVNRTIGNPYWPVLGAAGASGVLPSFGFGDGGVDPYSGQGDWEAYGSTGAEGAVPTGVAGSPAQLPPAGDLQPKFEPPTMTGTNADANPSNTFTGNPFGTIDPATGLPAQPQAGASPISAVSDFGSGSAEDAGFSQSGFESSNLGSNFSAEGNSLDGAPVGGDPNAPESDDELRRRAAASLAKPAPAVGSPTGTPTGTPTGAPAAPAAGAPTAPPAAGKGIFQKAVDSATNNPLGAASLGFNLYKQSQVNKNSKSAQDQLQAVAQPASDASKQLIAEGLSGNVPSSILTQFTTTANQQKDAIRARYANMGRDPNNDSSAAAELAKVDEARDAQIANYASTLLTQGLTAAGVANAPATQAILAGVNADREMQNAMSQMLQQMAFLESINASKKAA